VHLGQQLIAKGLAPVIRQGLRPGVQSRILKASISWAWDTAARIFST